MISFVSSVFVSHYESWLEDQFFFLFFIQFHTSKCAWETKKSGTGRAVILSSLWYHTMYNFLFVVASLLSYYISRVGISTAFYLLLPTPSSSFTINYFYLTALLYQLRIFSLLIYDLVPFMRMLSDIYFFIQFFQSFGIEIFSYYIR